MPVERVGGVWAHHAVNHCSRLSIGSDQSRLLQIIRRDVIHRLGTAWRLASKTKHAPAGAVDLVADDWGSRDQLGGRRSVEVASRLAMTEGSSVIPAQIAGYIGDADLEPIAFGRTSATVHRVSKNGQAIFYLKSCVRGDCEDLEQEAARLAWLQGRIRVPEVVSYISSAEQQHLLTTALSGTNGVEAAQHNPRSTITTLAMALAHLHRCPAYDCPFDHRRQVQVQRARARFEHGCVDESDFDEERRGQRSDELWHQLHRFPLFVEAPVLTHGDACLPNIILDGNGAAGFVDCGRAGLADPYQDLALASRSIAENLGPEWVAHFFQVYGLHDLDGQKLEFYRLLDEFF